MEWKEEKRWSCIGIRLFMFLTMSFHYTLNPYFLMSSRKTVAAIYGFLVASKWYKNQENTKHNMIRMPPTSLSPPTSCLCFHPAWFSLCTAHAYLVSESLDVLELFRTKPYRLLLFGNLWPSHPVNQHWFAGWWIQDQAITWKTITMLEKPWITSRPQMCERWD